MKLRKLWEKSPNCHWCGRLTRILKPGEKPRHPKDEATRDHLYSRRDKRRHDKSIIQPIVLACYECNHNRGSGESWTYTPCYALAGGGPSA